MPDQYYDFTQLAEKLQDDFNRVEAMQGVEQFTCTTIGTTHAITGGATGYANTVFKFIADADYNKTYNVIVNGVAVQCLLPNNDEVQSYFFRTGASVLCMHDATNNKLYFVGGGGSGGSGSYFMNRGVTTWTVDSTYTNFHYRGKIDIAGVTDADGVEVTFSNADASSGNYSPICETFDGGVYIWSRTRDTSLVIPTICIFSRGSGELDEDFPYLKLTGGTVTGDVTITRDVTTRDLSARNISASSMNAVTITQGGHQIINTGSANNITNTSTDTLADLNVFSENGSYVIFIATPLTGAYLLQSAYALRYSSGSVYLQGAIFEGTHSRSPRLSSSGVLTTNGSSTVTTMRWAWIRIGT